MIDREKLMEMRKAGFNCAQCIAACFCDKTGMDENMAIAATGGFGAGFLSGGTCGAVSAAIMVLGMLYPHTTPNAPDEKSRIAKLTTEFTKRFKEKYGYLDCRDLKGKGKIPCDELIYGAAEIMDAMLEEA